MTSEFGIVLVLVLGALGFRDRKETDVLELICSVILIGILEDEDDDEHEDDPSNSEFTLENRADNAPVDPDSGPVRCAR